MTDSIMSAVAAIVGALVGGFATYIASVRLERRKRDDATARLHLVVLAEVSGHSAVLAKEIDRIIPMWLLRGFDDDYYLEGIFRDGYRVELSTRSFDEFRHELLYSDLVESISGHYLRVQEVNGTRGDTRPTKADYVRACAAALGSSMTTLDVILARGGLQGRIKEDYRRRLEDHKSMRPWYEYRYALTQVDYEKLMDLAAGRDSSNELIPEIIKSDVTKEWKHFLHEAIKLYKP